MLTRILTLLCLVALADCRFFDVCPARRLSIGTCLAGLCPSESECINGYCCKLKSKSTKDHSIEENEEFGKCRNGHFAIGECIKESCPSGYRCENKLCCKVGSLPPVKVTMIPVELEVTRKPTTTKYVSTTGIPEAEEEEEEEEGKKGTEIEKETSTGEETEIESIKKTFGKKNIIEETDETDEYPETTTIEEEYLGENGVSDREEVDEVEEGTGSTALTTTSTTQAPQITTQKSTKRLRTRRPITTTTTAEPDWEEEEEEEVPTTTAPPPTTTTDSEEFDTGCPVGAPIGECVSNHCPEGHACFHNSCCILTPQINCTDTLSSCMPHLCEKRGYKEFMTKNCARTCATCHLADLDTEEVRTCRDRRSDCAEWAREGFCDSTLYSTRQKIKFCGKSCKLC